MTQLVTVRSFPLVNGKRILPEGVVYIGRSVPRVGLKASPWGNPYRIGEKPHPGGHEAWVAWHREIPARPCDCAPLIAEQIQHRYREYLTVQIAGDPLFVEPLRSADAIACWCDPSGKVPRDFWCHGQELLRALELHRPKPRPGEPIEFGVHAMPSKEAEAAPAWPSLASVRAAADAKFKREQRKVRA